MIAPASERLTKTCCIPDSCCRDACQRPDRVAGSVGSFRFARWATISTNDAAPSDQESEYFPAPSDSTWRSVFFASPPGGGRRSCPTSLPVRRSTQATVPLSDQTKPVTLAPSMSMSIPSRSSPLSLRERVGRGLQGEESAAAGADDVRPRRPKQRNGNAHDQRQNGDHARNDGDSAQRDDPPSELVAAFGSSGGGRFNVGMGIAGRRAGAEMLGPAESVRAIGTGSPNSQSESMDYFNSPSCLSTTFAGSGP